MRTITMRYNIYSFDELSLQAQNKAINDRINLWIEHIPFDKISHNSKIYKVYKECEEMQTPWFLSEYILEQCKEQVLKELKELEFLADGELFIV